MFRSGSCENELFSSMETTLVKNQSEATSTSNKLAKAACLLSDAAAIFKQAGMQQEAQWVADILNDLGVQ